jgi:predicted GNAT family acetyltransferase
LIEDRSAWFWETDGQRVSLAVAVGPTPNGIRIGRVYTPPERRGHGYASNLVAQLSAQLLAQGKKFCYLFTDIANPTSNSIYQKIGYRAVSDLTSYRADDDRAHARL